MALVELARKITRKISRFFAFPATEPDNLYELGMSLKADCHLLSLYYSNEASKGNRAACGIPEPPEQWVRLFDDLNPRSRQVIRTALGYAIRGGILIVDQVRDIDLSSLAERPTISERRIGWAYARMLKNLF